jgi:hypothetical protein
LQVLINQLSLLSFCFFVFIIIINIIHVKSYFPVYFVIDEIQSFNVLFKLYSFGIKVVCVFLKYFFSHHLFFCLGLFKLVKNHLQSFNQILHVIFQVVDNSCEAEDVLISPDLVAIFVESNDIKSSSLILLDWRKLALNVFIQGNRILFLLCVRHQHMLHRLTLATYIFFHNKS